LSNKYIRHATDIDQFNSKLMQLSDLLEEKKKELGSYAEIGRLLGGISGQVIGKYASGKVVPSIDFAVQWKKVFEENVIDLLTQEGPSSIASEPELKQMDNDRTIIAMEKTIKTQDTLINELRGQLEECRARNQQAKK